MCLPPSEGTEETREGQSVPRWPGPEMEVGISCWLVDGTLVNRCISAQIFTHFTQLITALFFAVYLVFQTIAPLEIPAAFPWTIPERLQLQAVQFERAQRTRLSSFEPNKLILA